LPDGRIELFGRNDRQVKIRGHRVELDEIENALSLHPEVKSCAVIAVNDKDGYSALVAYVTPRHEFESEALQNYLAGKLPPYMVPGVWIKIESMPITPNGKVARNKLTIPDQVESSRRTALLPPRTNTEATIAQIWKDVLAVDEVGVLDNFFELGGHSIVATRVISAIRKEFNVSVSVRAMFDFKKVYELAGYIDQLSESGNVYEEFEKIDV
jgi:acyl carrier protein